MSSNGPSLAFFVHLVHALLPAVVDHFPEDVQHRGVEVLDDPRRRVLVLEDGVLVHQIEVRLDPVSRRWPVLHPQGELPDAREVGVDEDLELVLHCEDAVHRRIDRHELLMDAA
eukprot:15441254-Alexandrium_andersonii.AAC.1